MCGRYSLATPDPGDLRARFGIGESLEIRTRYNVAPGDEILAVTTDREGHPRGDLLRWGLVPSWAKSPETGMKMINARLETVTDKAGVSAGLRTLSLPDRGRWVLRVAPRSRPVPSSRFTSPGPTAGHLRSPACGRSGTTTTTAAPSGPARSSPPPPTPRSPPSTTGCRSSWTPSAESSWLDTSTPRSELREILSGLPAESTAVTEVGFAVNNARYDGPECLAPPAPSVQEALF